VPWFASYWLWPSESRGGAVLVSVENTGHWVLGFLQNREWGEAVENTGTLFLLLRRKKVADFVFFSPRISGLIFALGGNYCCYLKVKPQSTYTFYLGTKIFFKGFLKFLYISTVRHP